MIEGEVRDVSFAFFPISGSSGQSGCSAGGVLMWDNGNFWVWGAIIGNHCGLQLAGSHETHTE